MDNICLNNNCTGCKACQNICKHSAIDFYEDSYGFYYPRINKDLCVDCGVCKRICPSNYIPKLNYPLNAFVGHAVNLDEQKSSTSGGIASSLCRYVIRTGGVVYGCTAMNYPKIHHIRVDNENELQFLKGSKYVQSDTELVFKQIKQDLKERRVIFVGTPCQCAGLKKYLRKDCDNLILVDFVCHGVPSQKILNDVINTLHIDEQINDVKFRRKEFNGKNKYGFSLYKKDGSVIYQSSYPSDDYFIAYLLGFFYRPSCYECKFAKIKRCSDITLGDYWDNERKIPLEKKQFGLSMILINTDKGKEFFYRCSSFIVSMPSNINYLIKRNAQLLHPMPKNRFYAEFQKDYLNKGWLYVCDKYVKIEKKRIKRDLFVLRIRDWVYRIPMVEVLYRKIFKR